MFEQTTLEDTLNATSLPESVDGQLPCASQDVMTLDLFGQVVALASPSQQQENKKATAMSATYGRIGIGSSESIALQRYLESRLQARLPLDGQMKSVMIWKRKVTPSHRQYCQLAVSTRLIKEIGTGLLLTPRAQESGESNHTFTKRMGDRSENVYSSLTAQLRAMYPTPSTSDAKGASAKRFKGSSESHGNLREVLRSSITDGQYPHPKFVAWMMGYSIEHQNCGDTATPLSRKLRRNLSKHVE